MKSIVIIYTLENYAFVAHIEHSRKVTNSDGKTH